LTCDTVAAFQHEPLARLPGRFEVRSAKSETVLPFTVRVDSGSISVIMRHLLYWLCRTLSSTEVSHSPCWRSLTNQADKMVQVALVNPCGLGCMLLTETVFLRGLLLAMPAPSGSCASSKRDGQTMRDFFNWPPRISPPSHVHTHRPQTSTAAGAGDC
jgi:hypothetical protein